MGVVLAIAALLAICAASSTAEGRAEARERMRKYDKPAWIIAAVLWAILILPEIF